MPEVAGSFEPVREFSNSVQGLTWVHTLHGWLRMIPSYPVTLVTTSIKSGEAADPSLAHVTPTSSLIRKPKSA